MLDKSEYRATVVTEDPRFSLLEKDNHLQIFGAATKDKLCD